MSPLTPEKVQKLQAALHAKAKGSPVPRWRGEQELVPSKHLADMASSVAARKRSFPWANA